MGSNKSQRSRESIFGKLERPMVCLRWVAMPASQPSCTQNWGPTLAVFSPNDRGQTAPRRGAIAFVIFVVLRKRKVPTDEAEELEEEDKPEKPSFKKRK